VLDNVVGLTTSLISAAARLMRLNVVFHSLEKMTYGDLLVEEFSPILSFNNI